MLEFNTLLVPMDFSDSARTAFAEALNLCAGRSPLVIVLHVIDPTLADLAAANEFIDREAGLKAMHARAERVLAKVRDQSDGRVEVQTIVCEGQPFLEILRKAEDFQVDAIVMGKFGSRGRIEKLLFGSTAERVLRGSNRPVLIIPMLDADERDLNRGQMETTTAPGA